MLLLAASLAGGCSQDPGILECPSECRIRIVLPEDPRLPPVVPRPVHVSAGNEVQLEVVGRRPGQARTILIFDEPALVDENELPLYAVTLETGSNRFRAGSWQSGTCRAPAGCRFTVINSGFGIRPPGAHLAGKWINTPTD